MKTLKEFNLKNKRVLVRCDFDVPLDNKGIIQDDFRIKQAIPTIEYLIKNRVKAVLMGHLGRPKGKVVESLRTTPIQEKLLEYLDVSVIKAPDCIGKEIEKQTKEMKEGEILLLENLRFHKEEEDNDPEFAKELAKLADLYVNNAFANSHRSHASIIGVPNYLPSGAGFLLAKEIEVLSKVLENPERPLVAVIGGIKIEDKGEVIEQFKESADYVLIGGKIAESVPKSDKVYLPLDKVEDKRLVLDIGPKTIDKFSQIIKKAKMIFWAGPMGLFEKPLFENGTKKIAQAIVNNKKAYKIVGGGDTLFAIAKFGLRDKFDHVSTGGGAMLDFLSGKELPGLKVLIVS